MCDVSDSAPENMEESFTCRAPYMLNSDDRLHSFIKNSPVKEHVTPREMVEAVFYYSDDSNRVICSYYGEGLKNWEPNDNPWYEHAK